MVPEQDRSRDTLTLWRTIFGDGEGYLCVASSPRDEKLTDLRERYFLYPGQAGEAAGYARSEDEAGRETYFCAHLLTEERRAKSTAAPIRTLYADGDGAQVPEGVPEPSIVVESSPGRTQLYWLLPRPVEPGVAERLNKRMTYAVGADNSGYDLTQLLRVPGTRNRKYADAPGVSITETTGELHDPDKLDRDLPEVPEEHDHNGELPEPASPPMEDEEVLGLCRRAKNGEKFGRLYDDGDTSGHGGDHSGADLALVGLLAFYTQDPEQIDRLFRDSALMRPKWDEKRGAWTYGERTIRRALAGRSQFYGAERDFSGAVMVDDEGGGEAAGVPQVSRGTLELPSHTVPTASPGVERALTPHGGGGVPPFPTDALPPALRRMTEAVVREMNVPPEYFAVPALAALSSAVGATRRLNVNGGGWEVYPDIVAAVVARSSDKKSPAYKAAMKPVFELQKELNREHEAREEEYEEEERRWEAEKKNTPKKEVPPPPPVKPEQKTIYMSDFTSEALAEVLYKTPRGILITSDELVALFNNMDQYKSGGKGSERQRHMMIMSNMAFPVHRRGTDKARYVENPVASYTGSIQPDLLGALLIPKPRKERGFVVDGMFGRWLYAFPEPIRTVDSLLTNTPVPQAVRVGYHFLHKKLRDLEMDDDGEARVVSFGPGVLERFDGIYQEWQRRKDHRPGVPELLAAAYGKMADHTARIALLLALCRDPDANTGEIVGAEDVENASRITDYFAAHAEKVYATVRHVGEDKDERYLRVLNGLLDGHAASDGFSDRWRVPTEELRRLLLEGGVYDLPENNTDLNRRITELVDRTPGLTIENKRVGSENHRGVEVVRARAAAPEHTVGTVSHGRPGHSRDTPRDTSGSGETGDARDLIMFVLREAGAKGLFRREIAERTEFRLKTIKNRVTGLVGEGLVEEFGPTENQTRRVRLVPPKKHGDDLADFGFDAHLVPPVAPLPDAQLDTRFLGSHDENEQKGA